MYYFPGPPTEPFFLRLKWIPVSYANPYTADSDGDKVPNNLEIATDSDPLHFADSDGDGMSDAWETFFGLAPGDPAGDATGPTDDPDEDGISNLDEYNSGPNGTDRHNYYNSGNPTMLYVSGHKQLAEAGTFSPQPLVVQLMAGGSPLNDGPHHRFD